MESAHAARTTRFSNCEHCACRCVSHVDMSADERISRHESAYSQSKPVAQDNLAEKLNFQQRLQAVTNKIHATSNIDEIMLELSAGALRPLQRRPADDLSRQRGQDLDRLQGQDRAQLVQGHQAADQRAVRSPASSRCTRRVINIRDVYDDDGAEVLQPAAELPEGRSTQDRLPHQADAGRAGARRADQGSDRRRADHQLARAASRSRR